MSIIEIIFVYIGISYLVLCTLMIAGLLRLKRGDKDWEPEVSIIIPARNEEKNLKDCLESITNIDYPKSKLQVIVIDDNSDDRTREIADSFKDRLENFTVVFLGSEEGSCGEGKLAALSKGYKKAAGEIVMQTDADCMVPAQWVRTVLKEFDEKTGIVGGITVLKDFPEENSCFTQIQSLDWLYLLSIGVGANSIGVPLSCIGNNLSVRKTAYESVGGYEEIPFSFTEDFAIYKAIVRSGWKSRFTVSKDSLIQSRPPDSFSSFVRQRIRWSSGGIKLAGPGIILLVTAFLFHVIMLIGLPFGVSVKMFSLFLILTSIGDFIFLAIASGKTGTMSLLRYFFLFELFYYSYTSVFGLISPLMSSVSWKGRKLPT